MCVLCTLYIVYCFPNLNFCANRTRTYRIVLYIDGALFWQFSHKNVIGDFNLAIWFTRVLL